MEQIKLKDVTLDYGDKPLFNKINLQIKPGEKIALIGRNGTGKSTLLKSITGEISIDSGEIYRSPHIIISQLQQEIPQQKDGTIMQLVCSAIDKTVDPDNTQHHLAEEIISKLGLDKNAPLKELSGGNIRRALLAKALATKPDVLLLDEPTNHLDLKSIIWLEQFLQRQQFTLILITHDRTFMQKIANKIIELDRGNLLSFNGDYQAFLKFKEQQLAAEERENLLFDKKLIAEEKWIRQGIKARRTRNEGRVRALKKMRQQYQQRRVAQGTINIASGDTTRSGKIIFTIKDLKIIRNQKTLIENFSTTIVRGDKIGIIGPNGCGKTSFISCLLQQQQPSCGQVITGTELQTCYFDQHRQQLDLDMSALDTVSEGKQYITIDGKEKHIISYLQDFLFSAEKSRSKVRTLSGGERNRLLLAKILAKPCNLLIMDEPSNDLDQESLELLEEYLSNYQGTLLLVSHDRTLLNNTVGSIIAFEGSGKVDQYVGGYDDWLTKHKPQETIPKKTKETKTTSYQTRKKIEKLLNKIAKTEAIIEKLQQKMAANDYQHHNPEIVTKDSDQLKSLNYDLHELYQQWEQLDEEK